ncbi:BZ3500_MvSof-1268-A1-R1_Chr5-3g08333 [Microbotryum saponariae]|uniref:BZ3500_MvSof-1268-A1-R1_Chr5-3g08333 protein n=1 Tax=Microbotryum saponariae TaxID=289078 RepID=A0A2X0L8T5_9BASI|nr:BZ3500_MvSof-1268-A1-R1_Chr5-3g08333 [Microbotryum saponariae]SDA08441.1 BZ3501_MvSof-1269-A2-R1_Chr5-3g08061 [Microbotryum saponariae]
MFQPDLSDPPLLPSSRYHRGGLHTHKSRKTGASSILNFHGVSEHLGLQAPLPSGSRHPVAAMQDSTLDDRVQQALLAFLGEHELADKVLAKAATLLEAAPTPIFCSDMPQCTATIHDWRIRVLEPLLKFFLCHYSYKMTGLPANPNQYRLSFTAPDGSQPSGITLHLLEQNGGQGVSLPIVFEHDSNFWTFGPQPHRIARQGQIGQTTPAYYYLEQKNPIPLDPNTKSHGAQAILNRLAMSMELAVCRNSETGEIMHAPRFGMLMSTKMSILAEVVENPRNAQEIGFLLTPILLDPRDDTQSRGDTPMPFLFNSRSSTRLALATLVDFLTHIRAPSPSTVAQLFGPPSIDKQEWRQVQRESWLNDLRAPEIEERPSTSVEVWKGSLFTVRAKLDHHNKRPRFINRPRGRTGRFLGFSVMEAVKFMVQAKPASPNAQSSHVHKPSRRLANALPSPLIDYLKRGTQRREGSKRYHRLSGLEVEDPAPLPALELLQLLAIGGAGWVFAGRLSQAPSQVEHKLPNAASTKAAIELEPTVEPEHLQMTTTSKPRVGTRKSQIPFDELIVIKVFQGDQSDSVFVESLFYEYVFPLLSPEARAVLPRYYGTFRSTDGSVFMLILEYGGRPIEDKDRTDDLDAKVDAAFDLLQQHGVSHGDQEDRNLLIGDDGSICIIDFDGASLDFDPEFLRDPV